MVRLSFVYKSYGRERHVLKNLHLKIERGEFVFLTGASGAGKTTLFRLITGFEKATSGTITVGNYNLDKLSPVQMPFFRRTIGVVYQDFRLLDDRTVFENVALPMEVMGRNRWQIEEEVSEMLTKVGLSSRAREYPSYLSGGEKQRVAIARALVHRPPIIIADEPTGNLDDDLSEEILVLLQTANRQGTTIIIATHDLNLVRKTEKKRLIQLVDGEIADTEDRVQWSKPLRQFSGAGINIL